MGTLTTPLSQFSAGYVLMAALLMMLGAFLSRTLRGLGQTMDIWKPKSKTSGIDMNPNPFAYPKGSIVNFRTMEVIPDLSSTVRPTQTASSNSMSNFSWLPTQMVQQIYKQATPSLTKCFKAGSRAAVRSPLPREQEREKLTGLLVSLEHCAKRVKRCLYLAQKLRILNSGKDISQLCPSLQTSEAMLSTYVTHLRQTLKKSKAINEIKPDLFVFDHI